MGVMRSLEILVFAVVVAGGLTVSELAAQSADGQALFMSGKCNMCHSVSSVEIEATAKSEKMRGPDLAMVADFGEKADVAKFLKKEMERNGKNHKIAFKGTDEELQALVDWLLEQR